MVCLFSLLIERGGGGHPLFCQFSLKNVKVVNYKAQGLLDIGKGDITVRQPSHLLLKIKSLHNINS